MYRVPIPVNEPVRTYAPGTPDRAELEKALTDLKNRKLEIPMLIAGEEVKTGTKVEICCPHKRSQVLGFYHQGSE